MIKGEDDGGHVDKGRGLYLNNSIQTYENGMQTKYMIVVNILY